MTRLRLPLLLIALTAVAGASLLGQSPRFRAGVAVVRVDALVTGGGGRPITGLTAANFELRDNGVPQRIIDISQESLPLNLFTLLDLSGSVEGPPLEQLKEGVTALIDALGEKDRAALLTFASRIELQSPLTADRDRLRELVRGMKARGSTSVFDAVFAGLAMRESDDGRALLYRPLLNYSAFDLDAIREMLMHPLTVPGLGDAGAHCGLICDGSFPTYLLLHWGRARTRGEKLPIEELVKRQTADTAALVGLADRGMLAPGAKADLNRIDPDALALAHPEIVRDLPAGVPVSYARTFVTSRPTRIGVVPVGYGHGYSWLLSNRGEMLVAGSRVPIVGRVTMDLTMVDLTGIPGVAVGDEVIIFGEPREAIEAREDPIRIEEVAGWAETIPWEILCQIDKRVVRKYVRAGRTVRIMTLVGERLEAEEGPLSGVIYSGAQRTVRASSSGYWRK